MLVAVCSLKGSPGVTTFSVALAALWPVQARCVLVECDPSGGDVATRFGLASSPGLVSLAAAARRSSDPGLLWQHTQALPGDLAVVVAPTGADQSLAALTALAPEGSGGAGVLRLAAQATDTVVIADCGRVDPTSPALPIVRSADVTLLLSRAHADDLAHLVTRLSEVSRWSSRPGLLLVGEGYSAAEVSRELGVPAMGRIPEDRHAAAVLCGRPGGRGGPSLSPLGHSAVTIARALLSDPLTRSGLGRSSAPVGQPVPVQHAAPAGTGHSVTANEASLPTVLAPDVTSRNGSKP
ncbi:MAG: chromosome partitioning protein [Pseudonocardiaceae bacterium]